MKDEEPEVFWTYPPVALFSDTVKALARVATATKLRKAVSLAMMMGYHGQRKTS